MKDAPKKIIPDASVLIKWALSDEEYTEQAHQLQNDFQFRKVNLFIPSHCFYELGNTLGKKWPDQCTRFFSQLFMSGFVHCRLTLSISSLAFELLKKYPSISFYDAVYHALAMEMGGIFVTADERYFKTTKKEGNIQLLKDYLTL